MNVLLIVMVDKDFFEGISTLSNSSADSMKHPSGDEALILKIEIENRVEELIVREGEPAKIAVNKFCARHSLPSEIELALLKKVVENLQPIKVQALSVEPKPRFIKKGNFIKKEIPRGRSVLSNTNRSLASPDKRKNEETKSYVQSPVIRNKSRSINPLNNSTQSINRKPRQQSNKL